MRNIGTKYSTFKTKDTKDDDVLKDDSTKLWAKNFFLRDGISEGRVLIRKDLFLDNVSHTYLSL